ncbi:(2Fe-2S)-binding protein [Mycobacterium sp. NPDC050853]|uniref:(2Fe-2S)-binding protein n=1 Tax=Mycobacterium sp. NPDC050853 TaxID=3155160 RepID=UPI00341128B5
MLTELSTFGPFFVVETHDVGDAPVAPWRPMADLVDEPAGLPTRINAVRNALAARTGQDPDDVDLRVASSIAHLGLVARIIAPVIGAMACGQVHISQELDDLWWQDQLGGPFPLSVTVRTEPGSTGLGPAVVVLTQRFLDRTGVSDRVLWGNVGSAVNSAAYLIAASRPELTDTARETADTYLRDPRIDDGALRAGPDFRRRSCCLIYQLTDDRSAVCGDCVLK